MSHPVHTLDSLPLIEQTPTSAHKSSHYSARTQYALGVNYIIGTGVFSLPFAFYSSGLLLGFICTMVGGFFSICCVTWTLDALARTEGIMRSNELKPSNAHDPSLITIGAPPVNVIQSHRRNDFTIMYRFFYGWKGMAICQAALSFYTVTILWAYAAVFASTVATLFFQFVHNEKCDIYSNPSAECDQAYTVSIFIFAVVVIPMACLDLGEQAIVQVSLTIYRFSAFLVMIVSVGAALQSTLPYDDVPPGATAHLVTRSVAPDLSMFTFFKWAGFGTMFTSAIVALCMHYVIPDLVHPTRDKQHSQKALMSSMTTAIFFYLLIGGMCAVYFGKHAEPLVTLNWTTYTGLSGGWGPLDLNQNRVWWAVVVQLWVMLFPCADMVSVYPMVCVSLANNLMSTVPEHVHARFPHRPRRLAFRFVASVPPILLALAENRLNTILAITGVVSFVLNFFLPLILALTSHKFIEKCWGYEWCKTPYSLVWSRPGFLYFALGYGVAALLLCLVVLIKPDIFTMIVQ